jgi:hypothetical protein
VQNLRNQNIEIENHDRGVVDRRHAASDALRAPPAVLSESIDSDARRALRRR